MPESARRASRWAEHGCKVAEAVGLLASLLTAEYAVGRQIFSVSVLAVAAAGILVAPGQSGQGELRGIRGWKSRLPVYVSVSAVTSLLCLFIAKPPARFYLFVPAWMAAMLLWRTRSWFKAAAQRAYRLIFRALMACGRHGHILFARVGKAVGAGLLASERRRLDIVLGAVSLLVGVQVIGVRFLSPPSEGLFRSKGYLVVCGYSAAAALAYVLCFRKRGDTSRRSVGENVRWMTLGAAWVYMMHPFFQVVVHGTPDATWYAMMLADTLAQLRAGVFPVYAGQSVYQFNGAIYSIRVAPAFHYLGGFLDILTFRTLGVFAVQNLLISLQALLALFCAYGSLAAVAPGRPWRACLLSILYLACPGVLSVAYNTDLYMSWMTVALLPLAACAFVGIFRRPEPGPIYLAAGALGLMWWGHTPIAVWSTLFFGGPIALRLLTARPTWRNARVSLAAGALFLVIASYPLVSVLAYPPEAGMRPAAFQVATAPTVARFLAQVFPAVYLPVSAGGRSLGDFQLGYGLWAFFLAGLCCLGRNKAPEFRALVVVAALVALLLLPIFGLEKALWSFLPGFVRNTNGNWPMNRLYLLLASMVAFLGALNGDKLFPGQGSKRRWPALALVVLCLWSLAEARKFAAGSAAFVRPKETAHTMLWTENVMVTQYAYLMFPKVPDYFSHGVVDPALESRLLTSLDDSPLPDRSESDRVPNSALSPTQGQLIAGFTVGTGGFAGSALVAREPIELRPGHRYIAEFNFLQPASVRGVLQLQGQTLFREYLLPDYGGPASFGVGGAHSRRMALWTSGKSVERVQVRFIPESLGKGIEELQPLASIKVFEYAPEALPVRTDSWIPYEARVRSQEAGWLETPREYQAYYQAFVNGVRSRVVESKQGLAAIPVPRGDSTVRLVFVAPALLALTFSLSMTAAVVWCLSQLALVANRRNAVQ
jgi:hypothetical protein